MHDQAARAAKTPPENRLGIDYRAVPVRKVDCPIVDIHTHVKDVESGRLLFEAAGTYGVDHVYSMTPLDQVEAVRAAFGEQVSFIAIPNWAKQAATDEFRAQWMQDLETFRAGGARLCKFWMAPRMRERHGITLQHEFMAPVVDRAQELEYDYMIHVGDPSAWWQAGKPYADTGTFGTKDEQYPQLEWLLARAAPRFVIAAHLGGNSENPAFLAQLLDRHQNLYLDSSAAKWIIREVSRHPDEIRGFLIRYADRVLFGSDLVSDRKYSGFDHYASRYWSFQMLWETPYRGESPIEDPDADGPPLLNGVDLPEAVLRKMYCENARNLGLY